MKIRVYTNQKEFLNKHKNTGLWYQSKYEDDKTLMLHGYDGSNNLQEISIICY